MTYEIPHFIDKFEATAESDWCMELYERDGRCCAFGHCGARRSNAHTIEAADLSYIFHCAGGSVLMTNDDVCSNTNLGQGESSPRARILAALRWIQKQEATA